MVVVKAVRDINVDERENRGVSAIKWTPGASAHS